MANTPITAIEYPNYAGMLFRKGNARTPFSALIGARPLVTNHTEFTTGVFFDAAEGTQPEISEQASLTAPDSKPVKRTQGTNVTQIFQQRISVSYHKEADMGSLQGLNAASQVPNPADELDFQVARALDQINADLEFTFLNGKYNKATSKDEVNKTRGLLEAITTNVIDVGSKADSTVTPADLTYWKVAEALAAIRDAGGETQGIVLGAAPAAVLQLNKDAAANNYTQGVATIMGINVQTVVTPLGTVNVAIFDSLIDRKKTGYNDAVLFNPAEMHPVYQPVPGKGNFFLEELAKVGASHDYQIYGEAGLDYGAEFHAAKLTGISNNLPSGNL